MGRPGFRPILVSVAASEHITGSPIRDRSRRGGSGARSVMPFLLATLVALLLASQSVLAGARRVMSLDYCADQYVLALADRDQILALSKDAESERSYYAAAARGLPRNSGEAEEIVMARPDLVIRFWGGGYGSEAMIRRFAIPTLTLPFGQSLSEMSGSLRKVAQALGQEARAEALIADMERRLAAVRDRWRDLPQASRPLAFYVTSGGTTTGQGTLVHEMMLAAGLRNAGAERGQAGWRNADLERLILDPPEAMILGFHDLSLNLSDHWRLGRHRSLRALLAARPTVYLDSRILACPTPAFVEGVEQLHAQLVAPRLAYIEGLAP